MSLSVYARLIIAGRCYIIPSPTRTTSCESSFLRLIVSIHAISLMPLKRARHHCAHLSRLLIPRRVPCDLLSALCVVSSLVACIFRFDIFSYFGSIKSRGEANSSVRRSEPNCQQCEINYFLSTEERERKRERRARLLSISVRYRRNLRSDPSRRMRISTSINRTRYRAISELASCSVSF